MASDAKQASLKRVAFVMQVQPDQHKEYERRHRPIWPELEAVLKVGEECESGWWSVPYT